MKIGLICPYNIFKGGGVQECVLALQNEYQKAGHSAVIITPRPRGVNEESTESLQLIGGGTDIKSPLATTAQISVSVDTKAIDGFLDEHKFDILHFHEPWVPILSRQLLSKSTSINIATFHAKLPETAMTKTLEKVVTPYTRSILKFFTTFTAVSDAAASYVRTITNNPIEIVPNGIDLSKYEFNDSAKKPIVLFVGRLEKRKGVKYLLNAFKIVDQKVPGASLIIAGDGPDRQKLELYARESRIKNVTFVGFISEAEKLQYLEQAAVFCSPALYGESFGIVLLEAMATGVPVVAADNPGYTSVMSGKGMLSLVDPKDENEFARKIELFINDADIRKLWISWAKDYVQQFSYDRVAEAYIQIYKQALEKAKTL